MIPSRKSIRFCRPARSGAGERIVPLDSARMFKTSVLLVLCCLAVGSDAVPISSSRSVERRSGASSSNDHCQHHLFTDSISCTFHDTCIESTFQCGPQGLALRYAKPRCDGVRLLQYQGDDSSCPTCIQNQAILDWLLHSETCFQSELLHLAQNQTSKQFPDPPDCLNFETEALSILEQCYSESNSICQLMDSAFEDLESDLKVVLNTVIVNPYYKSIVTKQFKALISSCSHSQASSLATKVAPETESILLCASLLDNKISEESLAQALAERLNQSPTDFKLSSYDPDIVSSCQEMSSRDWNVGDADYYLVLWTLSTGADKNALEQCQTAGACSYNIDPFVYFQYTDFTTSSCGNGLREAGESCDLFIYTGKEGYGCSKQCHTIPGHECTTQHLEQSFCSKTVCGDGRRTSDEECDEGTASSVGCNPQSCTIQEGYRCEGSYNATSYCTELLTPSQIVPTSSTKLVINPPTSSPVSLPRESPSGVEAFEAEPTNGGLASGAHSMQRTLHLWNVVLTSLLVFLLFNLIWR